MGYTHNWYRPQVISASTFNAIAEDFQKIVPALEAAGSPIANAYGLEEPEFTPESIRFNGVRHCGHMRQNPEVRLPWPGNGASGIGDNTGILSGTLPFRTCNGDCSYESVWFDRCAWKTTDEMRTAFVADSAKQPFVRTTLPLPCSC